tara:strand:+ start:6935 stop:7909 length:975 start_codon:yes stop_codon:yes gene_type:complete
MRFIFISIFLLIISCSKDDTYISEKHSDDSNSSLKDNFNSFIFYEGQASYSINHNGLDREYILYIPPNIESRTNLPVIFNFHGYQGRANQFFNMTDLIDIANENGVVLVYPQGAPLDGGPSHWNAAPLNSSTPSFVNKSNVNDLDFFSYLLNDVNQNNILDLNRVYAIGYSNGGMFSHFLACNTENIFAAIGDVAGTMLLDTFNSCSPSSPVPVLKIHGTSDNVVSYNGFDQAGFKTVEDVVNFWKTNNKSNEQFILNNFVSSSWANYMGPVNFEKYTYESNENDSEVVHYKMLGGGHWWDYSFDNNLRTSSLLWNFFSKHSKQ